MSATTEPRFDLLDPGFTRDPFPLFDEIRSVSPVWWWEDAQSWLVTGFDEMAVVMRDPRFSPSQRFWTEYVPKSETDKTALDRFQDHAMFNVAPADHVRLRRLVTKAFTPQGVEAQRSYTQGLVDELTATWRAGDRVDLASELFMAVPARVIAHLLGLRDGDVEHFVELADDFLQAMNPLATPEELQRAVAAIEEQSRMLDAEIRRRRHDRPDDLLTRLLEAEEDGDRLSRAELDSLVISLVFAGSDTTSNQMSHGMISLLDHPEQFRRLADDPSLLDSAIEEVLRFLPPGKALPHFAIEDVELGGQQVRAGQAVFFSSSAGHRDPRAIVCPHVFDIERDNSTSMPFGGGAHYCLGAALARLELSVAIGTLVERFPAMTRDGEAQIESHLIMRPVSRLPVIL